MKRRKNVLIIMAVLYIIAAVFAVAVFLIRPVSSAGTGQEDNKGTNGAWVMAAAGPATTQPATVQSTAQQKESAARPKEEQTASAAKPKEEQTTAARPKEEQTTSAAKPHGQEASQPAAQVQPRTETQTAAPDSPLLDEEYDVLYRAVSKKGSVNMRRAPDNLGTVVLCIPPDGECDILLEDVNGWMLVRYNEYTGFVYGSFLEPVWESE